MTMRQKKNLEAERRMEENKRKLSWKLFPAELAILILGVAGMWFLGGIRQLAKDRILSGCVLTVLGLAVTGFHFRREYLRGELDYNNGDHVFRFWLCMGLGLVVAFACGFLPVAGWPFLLVFVLLALFSNMSTGILGACVLLMIPVILSGGSVDGFVLYLVSGTFAVTLFQHLESDFKFGIPMFMSIFCLLVCETASLVLTANARPNLEMFVIPVANLIISSLLLLGCLKLFSSAVVYQHRDKYLDINDTENPVLVRFREQNRQEYMHAIHTTYFCERIGMQLGMDVDALKCAGYYYRLGEDLEQAAAENNFPPAAMEILLEYQSAGKRIIRRETAVLVCADTVLTTVNRLLQQNPGGKVDFDRAIDEIFEKFLRNGSFNKCRISIEEFRTMQKIFKGEKLYYDFLR